MDGKVCLVTGAMSGIGKATAEALADLGATVSPVTRDQARGEATAAEVAGTTGNDRVEVFLADPLVTAVRPRAGRIVPGNHERLHVLLNCAGAYCRHRRVTVDGLELTFALNHLAYFLLTTLVLELLEASAPARVVKVTSGAHLALDRFTCDGSKLSPSRSGERPPESPGPTARMSRLTTTSRCCRQIRMASIGPRRHSVRDMSDARLHSLRRARRRRPPETLGYRA